MKLRPFDIWWLGVLLFTPSLALWTILIVLFWNGGADYTPSWSNLRHTFLPCLAALLGFCVPIVCLRLLRRSPPRLWVPVFVTYCVILLTWGLIDIRHENYQVGGHNYPNGILVNGHKYYFHHYYTWYFLPYRWIEKGLDDD